MNIPGILNKEEDTEFRRLLAEVPKDKIWQDELRTIEKLEALTGRLTGHEARQILEIHGRII